MKNKSNKEGLISISGSIWDWWQPARKKSVSQSSALFLTITASEHLMCLVAFQLTEAEEPTLELLQIFEQ